MPGHGLTDLVLALLHAVAAPCHRHQIVAPAPPLQPPTSATPHRRVLESSPSPERSAYRLMEPSDPDTSPWGHRVGLCAVHDWACPNRVAPAQGPSSSGIYGEEEGREEEADERRIMVVTGPVGAPAVRRTAHITIGPRGRTQGPLVPRTESSSPPSPISPTLAAPPPPPPALSSTEAGLSGSGTSSDLLSLCGKWVLRWFARFAAPSGKGRALGSGPGTRRPGQAIERRWGQWRSKSGSALEEQAPSGEGTGGVQHKATAEQPMPTKQQSKRGSAQELQWSEVVGA
jgi:hypothetical protein